MVAPCSQGVALGWRMPPLRGEENVQSSGAMDRSRSKQAPAAHDREARYTYPQTALPAAGLFPRIGRFRATFFALSCLRHSSALQSAGVPTLSCRIGSFADLPGGCTP